MENNTLHKLGIDIGSTTVKVVVLDDKDELLFSDYERHFANIRETLSSLLQKAFDALSLINEDSWADTDPDKIVANATALARAVAYKKKNDMSVKSDEEIALESNQSLLYENLKRDNPKLYKGTASGEICQ